ALPAIYCGQEFMNGVGSKNTLIFPLYVASQNARETSFSLRKMPLVKSKRKEPEKDSEGRCPDKSSKFILDLLKNAESIVDVKGLDVDSLYISHIQVNQAQKKRRRTYPYMSSPCHIELTLSEKEEAADTQLAPWKSKKSQVLCSGASSSEVERDEYSEMY
ncbi:hypothetical protein MKX03_022236, partial [Papaver bracteatum]